MDNIGHWALLLTLGTEQNKQAANLSPNRCSSPTFSRDVSVTTLNVATPPPQKRAPQGEFCVHTSWPRNLWMLSARWDLQPAIFHNWRYLLCHDLLMRRILLGQERGWETKSAGDSLLSYWKYQSIQTKHYRSEDEVMQGLVCCRT